MDDRPEPPALVARTSRRLVTPTQLAAGVVALATAGAALVNVVSLLFVDDRTDPAVLAVGCTVIAVAAILVLRRMRRADDELRVDADGLVWRRRDEVRTWAWAEIHELAVATGVERTLIVLDVETAARVQERAPRLGALNRSLQGLTGGHPLATRVPLTSLEPGEGAIVEAVRRCSGGRFPGPDLGTLRLPGR